MARKKALPPKRSPWLAVTIGILGLMVGYGFVMGKTSLAFASSANVSCPMHKQLCKGMDCNHDPLCASGACSKDCPGNCNHPA